jgi:hypothetical protein
MLCAYDNIILVVTTFEQYFATGKSDERWYKRKLSAIDINHQLPTT